MERVAVNSIPRQLPLLLLFLLLALLLLAHTYTLIPLVGIRADEKRMLQILLLFSTLFLTLLLPQLAGRNLLDWFSPAALWLLILLISLGLVSALQAPSVHHALLEVSTLLALLLLALVVANITRLQPRHASGAVSLLVITSAGIYIIGFFMGYLAAMLERLPIYFPEPLYGYDSIRFFNQFQIWTFPLFWLALHIFRPERKSVRLLLHSLSAGWWLLLLASGSRGALIALAIAAALSLALYRRQAIPLLKQLGLGFVIGLGLYLLMFHWLIDLFISKSIIYAPTRTMVSDRLALWAQAIDIMKQHPCLGIGPMHYAWVPNFTASHPHSSVFQLLAEWGIPATLLFLALIIMPILAWMRRFNAKTLEPGNALTPLRIALFFAVSSGLVYSLVSGVIVMPTGQAMLAVSSGLMIGLYHAGTDNQPQTTSLPARISTRLCSGILLLLFTWSVLPGFAPRLAHQYKYIEFSKHTFGPRYWLFGGIPRSKQP